jgi:hypothetical protein
MKFTTLIPVLLLPWAVVESRSRGNFVSIGMEYSLAGNEIKQTIPLQTTEQISRVDVSLLF